MRHFFASMNFIEIEFKIFENRTYMKFNNAMIEASYLGMMKEQGKSIEKQGEWAIMEVIDEKIGKEENKLYEYLADQLKKGGFTLKDA